jgi:L-lactate dehydrogenase complex protein LldG
VPGRAEFLASIRHRTQAGRYKPTNAPDVAWTGETRESEPIGDPPSRFIEELEALGGHGKRAGSLEEAREYVLELARERDAKLLVRWDVDELEELGIDGPLSDAGIEVAVWRDLADFREVASKADIGLSVPVERMLRTVPEAIEKYAAGGLPANVCFHSGPSRSGDIEMALFVGMHGPGDVHVILVG